MPLQHADKDVLRAMNRPSDPVMTMRLIEHARKMLPELVMRTTFIVGYPGETDEQFGKLLRFVEEQEFDHVGVFTYSLEPGTKAATLDDRIPDHVAEERRNAIMEAQQSISLKKNRRFVGQEMRVLVEAVGEMEDSIGRTEPISVGRAARHAPEVDGMVFIPGQYPVGEFATVNIAEATAYDLWAAGGSEHRDNSSRARHRARIERRRVRDRREARGLSRGKPVPMATPSGT
jgi:ribosomal protein S12 methylthiotransferase